MSKWQAEKKAVLAAVREIHQKGLAVGKTGNISCRLPPEKGRALLAITPSAREYDRLGEDDIQIIDFDARPVEGNLPASTETLLHIAIYRARADAGAVLHTHSVFASAAAVAGLDIPPVLEDQVIFLGGAIRLAGRAAEGQEQTAAIIAALEDRGGVLMPGHGAVGVGRTLRDALTAAELIEKTAKVYWLALSIGKANPLPPDVIEAKRALYKKSQSHI
jgi:L-fuculose-phosphate aldolase